MSALKDDVRESVRDHIHDFPRTGMNRVGEMKVFEGDNAVFVEMCIINTSSGGVLVNYSRQAMLGALSATSGSDVDEVHVAVTTDTNVARVSMDRDCADRPTEELNGMITQRLRIA